MVGDGGEGGDDFGGGLNATEEGRHEDAVEREAEIVAEVSTRFEGPNPTLLNEGRVPGSGRDGYPRLVEAIDAVAVPHYDDALVKLRSRIHSQQRTKITKMKKRERE